MNHELFSKNFIILLIGQSLSMFGNNIIRFAISLYILEETQSASAYGIVTAVSYTPTILFSPFGGVLADRCNKKNLTLSKTGKFFSCRLPASPPIRSIFL